VTYGEIRLFLTQWAPGTPLNLISGWIQDRYSEILGRLMWTRQKAQIVLQAAASYATGTVAVTAGGTELVGTGTTWTSDMNGRLIRINEQAAFYTFTFVDATNATIDRAYEGETESGLSYRIDQNLIYLPPEARAVEQVRRMDPPGVLTRWDTLTSGEDMPNRASYGTPLHWLQHMDSQTEYPVIQLELLPIPELLSSYPITYWYEDVPPTATATTLLPWMQPGAIKAGVQADISGWQKDYTGQALWEKKFEDRVLQMQANDHQRKGQTHMRLSPWMVRMSRSCDD